MYIHSMVKALGLAKVEGFQDAKDIEVFWGSKITKFSSIFVNNVEIPGMDEKLLSYMEIPIYDKAKNSMHPGSLRALCTYWEIPFPEALYKKHVTESRNILFPYLSRVISYTKEDRTKISAESYMGGDKATVKEISKTLDGLVLPLMRADSTKLEKLRVMAIRDILILEKANYELCVTIVSSRM